MNREVGRLNKYLMNRKSNTHNRYQGKWKRVLCVCSAGLLRSPTASLLLSREPYNYNTRSAGLSKEFALVVVDEVLLEWCDEIVCMNREQEVKLREMTEKPIICLDIEDEYEYREERLIKLVKERYDKCIKSLKEESIKRLTPFEELKVLIHTRDVNYQSAEAIEHWARIEEWLSNKLKDKIDE